MKRSAPEDVIHPPMSKTKVRAALYRLIDAGQLARKALLTPLSDRGLQPGDDAVIFALHARLGATMPALCDLLETSPDLLSPIIDRLAVRDIVRQQPVGPELVAGWALTERGERLQQWLAGHWVQLEEALFGDLSERQRRLLSKSLKRFTQLMRTGEGKP